MLCGGHAFYCQLARRSTEELVHKSVDPAGSDDFIPDSDADDPGWYEERVLDRVVQFPSPEWDGISDYTKDLIRHMLLVDLTW
ncbi:hypothetical protein LTS18_003608, partial [Coniosporium uncinatum]